MSRYRFELAGLDDDADLRHVLANTPMPGRIALTFRREPSFFAAPGVDGFLRQVVACRDLESRRIVGFGCRALRRMYVHGEPRTIGTLAVFDYWLDIAIKVWWRVGIVSFETCTAMARRFST